MTDLRALVLPLALLIAGPATAGQTVPARLIPIPPAELVSQGRVTDGAKLLAAAQREELAHDLAGIEARTRAQVVVATVPTLGGRDIALFARELGARWSVGDAQRNDGVVVLLAPNEQLVRIAVGSGLEKTLTDEVCQRIINEVMLPEFREGRLYEGLSKGVAALNAEL